MKTYLTNFVDDSLAIFVAVRLQRQCDGARGDAPRREPDGHSGAEAVAGRGHGPARPPSLPAREAGVPLPPEQRPLLHARPRGHCHARPPTLLRHEVGTIVRTVHCTICPHAQQPTWRGPLVQTHYKMCHLLP